MTSREIKKGSMREVFNGIYTILRTDEELMRALCYPPEDVRKGILHPMDERLDNIVNFDAEDVEAVERYWKIVENTIKTAEKVSEVEEDALCRLYIYPGKRRSVFGNYLMAKQEVTIDVLVSEGYSAGYRLEWINDRVSELLSLERVQGALGYVDYAGGQGWQTSIGYAKYKHQFVFGTGKK